jgi:hypothetical protein
VTELEINFINRGWNNNNNTNNNAVNPDNPVTVNPDRNISKRTFRQC